MEINQDMVPATGDQPELIRVRLTDGQVRHFVNRCPHLGVPLDWGNGQCLSADRSTLICAMHMAIFDPDTGMCVAGPCAGRPLTKVQPLA